jgi:hypothetical protein
MPVAGPTMRFRSWWDIDDIDQVLRPSAGADVASEVGISIAGRCGSRPDRPIVTPPRRDGCDTLGRLGELGLRASAKGVDGGVETQNLASSMGI